METNGQISVWINGQFAQIWHNNSFHWATVSSNPLNKHGTIGYYDSLFHGRIKYHTKIQSFNLFKWDILAIASNYSLLSATNKWG